MDDLDLGSTVKAFMPGQKVFGRYTLTRLLGRGGMGVVWLAHDDKLERDVALKFLPEVMMGDKLALADLKRETKRSLELTHPHIVRIYDFVDDARTAGIAMEYIAGETLGNARVEKPGRCFEVAELSSWVAQLCAALDYAHAKAQVVHRDLKPANLMVDAKGDLKVTDFGIASSISDSVSRVSKQAGTSGTPMYMSPQQMMGEKPAASDDIYALGATLFDLLTGKPPFHSGNILMQVQTKVPPTIATRRAELGHAGAPIPAEWEATIAACLAKDPAERPQSAGEVAERLGLAPGGGRRTEGGGRRTEKQPAAAQVARVEPNARASAAESGLGSSRSTSKAPIYGGAAVAVLVFAGLGWYLGVHQPEQRRIELARIEAQRADAERQRTDAEARLAAEKRQEAERIEREAAAVRLAEQKRQADEQARAAAAAQAEAEVRAKAEAEKERLRLQAIEQAQDRRVAELQERIGRAARAWDFEGLPDLEAAVARDAADLDERRRASVQRALDDIRPPLAALRDRVEARRVVARKEWLESTRMAGVIRERSKDFVVNGSLDLLRAAARGAEKARTDLLGMMLSTIRITAWTFEFKDVPSGREFVMTRYGLLGDRLIVGDGGPAFLHAYAGPGARLFLGDDSGQDVCGYWAELPPGELTLRIERKGWKPQSRRIVLEPDKITVVGYDGIRVSVTGAVGNPGQIALPSGGELMEAILKAGDFTPVAARGKVTITRIAGDGSTESRTFDLDALAARPKERPWLADGDVIFVPERLL